MARNIEEGYSAYVNGVKINGIAYVEHGIVKSGSTLTLTTGCLDLGSSSVGDYALFAGGITRSDSTGQYLSSGNAVNSSLTKSNIGLFVATEGPATANNDNYAIFAGGQNSNSSWLKQISGFNSSLSMVSSSLTNGNRYLKGGSVNNIMCITGYESVAFNSSFTRMNFYLSNNNQKIYHVVASNDSYLIYAGGIAPNQPGSTPSYSNNAVNDNLTISYISNVTWKMEPSGVSTNDYAIIAGGSTSTTASSSNTIEAFDKLLTKQALTNMSAGTYGNCGAFLNGYFMITGGHQYVNCYDMNFTKITVENLKSSYRTPGAAANSKYIIFAGGANNNTDMDIYKVLA